MPGNEEKGLLRDLCKSQEDFSIKAAKLRQQAEALLREKESWSDQDLEAQSPEQIRKVLHELEVHQIELEMQNENLLQAQLELEASQARYFDLYELAPVGYCTVSATGMIMKANLTVTTLLGVPRASLVGQPFSRFIFAEDQDIYYLHRKHLFGTGESQTCELRMVKNDKVPFWVQLTEVVIQNENGMPVSRLALSGSPERRLSEEALRKSEEKYRSLVETAQELIWRCDKHGKFTYLNPAWEKSHGYKLEAMLGRGFWEFVPSKKIEQNMVEFSHNMAGESTRERETIHCTKDGRLIKLLFNAIPLLDSEGNIIGTQGTAIDITERKKVEEATQRDRSRLNSLVNILQQKSTSTKNLLDNALDHAIALTGSKIGFIFHYQETHKELVLRAWSKEVLPECTVAEPKICYELGKTGFWGEAIRQRRSVINNDFQAEHPLKKGLPEGHVQLHKFMAVPIIRNGHIVSMIGLANKEDDFVETDVLEVSLLMETVWQATENIQNEKENTKLERQLQQAQKMEAIGTLAGGIAHDFNNILGAILGYAEMALDDCPTDSIVASDIDQVIKAGHRARELVKQILAFSRQADTERIALQPAVIVREACHMLRSSLPSTISIEQDIDPSLRLILADPTQIHQILMNLCTNAYHAMEMTGGSLSIRVKNKTLTSDDLAGVPDVQPGNYVQMSVSDTGAGIGLEIQERMFDPYFTTKETGKGTGLGLSITHGIVKSYRGFVSCYSQPDEGTVFHVFLPAITDEILYESEQVEPILFGKEHVLLIDDEEILVEMGKTMLERLGYRVTVRTNSIEALTTFQNQPREFDLVITDQTMPGMTGTDLARRMLQLRPDLPIILCTGYSNLISEEKSRSIGITGFALKPLAKKDIATLIRKALDKSKTLN